MTNEEDVFTKHYASLHNIITDVKNLLPYFVEQNIINIHDEAEINAIIRNPDKVKKLLSYIAGPLKAGDAKGFHTMLAIMEKHGNQGTRDLAVRMSREVTPVMDYN